MKNPGSPAVTRSITEAIRALDSIPLAEVFQQIDLLDSQLTGDPTLVTFLRERYHAPHALPPAKPGDVIGGRYRILKQLGAGGMGQVYAAEQTHVKRKVALKMISPALASEPMIHRMAGEISSLGRLNHAGIVRVFDADVHHAPENNQSSLYFTMEVVEGDTIDRWASGEPVAPSLDAVLRCFAEVCEAVAFAHDRGVVHRDLKPGNIMVRADGTPAVLDFGIASVRDANLERAAREAGADGSAAQGVSGTPQYMSPAKWRHDDDMEAGDVFALGVVLFEILSGQRPWLLPDAPSLENVRHAIVEQKPRRLRSIVPSIDPSLDALVDRILTAEPKDRPSSRETGHALRTILRNRERKAWLARWGAAIATGAIALAGVVGFGGWKAWIRYERLASETHYMEAVAYLDQAGLDPAARVEAVLPPPPARHDDEAWRDLLVQAHAQWRLVPFASAAPPPGARVVASDTECALHLVVLADERVAIWDGARLVVPAAGSSGSLPPGPLALGAFCPGRDLVALRSGSGDLAVWDFGADSAAALGTFADGGDALAFSPDGSQLACGSTRSTGSGQLGRVTVWKVGDWAATPEVLEMAIDPSQPIERQAECRSVWRLAWSHDGNLLATVGKESTIAFVWRRDAGRWAVQTANFHPALVTSLAWSSSRNLPFLATGRSDGIVSVWPGIAGSTTRLITSDPALEFGGAPGSTGGAAAPITTSARRPVSGLVWLPGDAACLAVSESGRATSWALRNTASPARRFDFGGPVATVSWHADSHVLSLVPPRGSGGRGVPTPGSWQWKKGRAGTEFYLPFDAASLDFNHDGALLAVGGDKGIAVGAALLDVAAIRVVHEWTDRLSGPVKFESHADRLWMFPRGKGLVLLQPGDSEAGSGPVEGTRIAKPESATTGSLAFSGDGRTGVFSLGTQVSMISLNPDSERGPSIQPDAFSLGSADRVKFALNRTGNWLATTSGTLREASVYRKDRFEADTWTLTPLLSDRPGAVLSFGGAGALLQVFRPPVLERWDVSTGKLVDASIVGESEPTAGGLPGPSRLCAAEGLTVATAGHAQPHLLRAGEGGLARVAGLGWRGNSGAGEQAISRSGELAAVSNPCLQGTLVVIWNLKEISELLDAHGFEPVPLEPAKPVGAE